MNKINRRSPFAIVGRLIVLVKPMLPVMLAAMTTAQTTMAPAPRRR